MDILFSGYLNRGNKKPPVNLVHGGPQVSYKGLSNAELCESCLLRYKVRLRRYSIKSFVYDSNVYRDGGNHPPS